MFKASSEFVNLVGKVLRIDTVCNAIPSKETKAELQSRFGTDSWADPITLLGPHDWMATSEDPEYCSWDGPGEQPTCSGHHYEEGLIYLAHQAGAEVYPSIGGWSLSDPFPAMAANPTARKNFAQQCVALIKNYNFDGIDIDWEYPGYEEHSGTPDDTENFNLLLDDLRSALDELESQTGIYYGLTAALPCGPSIIDNQDIAHVSSVLTELNLMTYDFHGTWNNKTGVNAPLYDQEGSPEMSVDGCVANWLEGGAQKDKINVGFPFYGRSFAGAKGLYEDFDGTDDKANFFEDDGVPQYYNIIAKLGDMTSVRDEQTATQYAYSKTGVVSYDDPRAICDKTEYAISNGLNGYIIWEISGDLMEDLSTPLLDAANEKLSNPSLDCSNMTDVSLSSNNEEDQNASYLYYPLFDGSSSCVNDGNQPSYYSLSDMFDNKEDCCEKHFSWTSECLDSSDMVDGNDEQNGPVSSLYYPLFDGVGSCVNDGNQPPHYSSSDMFDNKEDCCEKHFSWNSNCVSLSSASIDSSSTTTTAATSISSSSSKGALPMYYPKEGFCVNDGNQPSYLTPSELFETEEDCCLYHYSWNSNCLNLENAMIESSSPPITTITTSGTTSSSMYTTTGSIDTTSTSVRITTTTTQYESTAETSSSTEPIHSQNILAQRTTTTSTTSTPPAANLDSTLASSTTTAFATTTTNIAITTELVHFDSTTTTTTSAIHTTTSESTTPAASTTDAKVPFNQFISSTSEYTPEKDVPSQADAFSSTSQQSMAAPIHLKDPDQSLATSYLNDLSSAISNALSQESIGKKEKPEPNRNGDAYTIPVQPFYVDILPYNSGYKLEVRNPNQMSKAVSGFLMSYFDAMDKWPYGNELIDFQLDCQKGKEKFGSEVKLVLSCKGDGIFDGSSIPSRREMNDLINSAFTGSKREEFLEHIYSDYVSELQPNTEDWKQSKEEPEQRSHDPSKDKDEEEDKKTNEVKQNKKEEMMLERKRQQMKEALDKLSGRKRLLRSRIDNK
eukprot:CCRYP_010560-RD/>CCRYP_010560-RD protein AED:0.28 eAED:0.28 QI:394/1/1/1/0.91/0.84/13/21/1008